MKHLLTKFIPFPVDFLHTSNESASIDILFVVIHLLHLVSPTESSYLTQLEYCHDEKYMNLDNL